MIKENGVENRLIRLTDYIKMHGLLRKLNKITITNGIDSGKKAVSICKTDKEDLYELELDNGTIVRKVSSFISVEVDLVLTDNFLYRNYNNERY